MIIIIIVIIIIIISLFNVNSTITFCNYMKLINVNHLTPLSKLSEYEGNNQPLVNLLKTMAHLNCYRHSTRLETF